MEANLAALEEEVSILKGEIKSILQEVRMAVLASENPFAGGSALRQPQAEPLDVPSEPRVVQVTAAPSEAPAAIAQAPQTPPQPMQHLSPVHSPAEAPDFEEDQPAPARIVALPRRQPASARAGREVPQDYVPARRADVRALSALLSWVEETRERLDERRYKVVLGLARYGGLIDIELRETLLDAGKTVTGPAALDKPSINDCIVALRQLEAILADEVTPYGDRDGPYREVLPSRRL